MDHSGSSGVWFAHQKEPDLAAAKNSTPTANGPSSSSSTSPPGSGSGSSEDKNTSKDPNLVNYSDSSNDNDHDNDKDAPMFDMEVDEDGAPKLDEQESSAASNNTTIITPKIVPLTGKRPVTETEIGENNIGGVEAKKAKLEEQNTTTTTDA